MTPGGGCCIIIVFCVGPRLLEPKCRSDYTAAGDTYGTLHLPMHKPTEKTTVVIGRQKASSLRHGAAVGRAIFGRDGFRLRDGPRTPVPEVLVRGGLRMRRFLVVTIVAAFLVLGTVLSADARGCRRAKRCCTPVTCCAEPTCCAPTACCAEETCCPDPCCRQTCRAKRCGACACCTTRCRPQRRFARRCCSTPCCAPTSCCDSNGGGMPTEVEVEVAPAPAA